MNHNFSSLAEELFTTYGFDLVTNSKERLSIRKNNLSGTLTIDHGKFTEAMGVIIIYVTNKDTTGALMPFFQEAMDVICRWIQRQEKPYLIAGNDFSSSLEDAAPLLKRLSAYDMVPLEQRYANIVKHQDYHLFSIWRTNQNEILEFMYTLVEMQEEWELFRAERSRTNKHISPLNDINLFEPSTYPLRVFETDIRIEVISMQPFETKLTVKEDDGEFFSQTKTKIYDWYMKKMEETYRLKWLVKEKSWFLSIQQLLVLAGTFSHVIGKHLLDNFVEAGYSYTEIDIIFNRLTHLLDINIETIKKSIAQPNKIFALDGDASISHKMKLDSHIFTIHFNRFSFDLVSKNVESLELFIRYLSIIKH